MKFSESMQRVVEQFTTLLPLDVLPSLKYLPYFRNQIRNTTLIADEYYNIIDRKIDTILSEENVESFINCFVEREGKNFDRTQLKVTIRDLVGAATETITSTLLWAIVLLANHREVQERLQREVDSVVPRHRLPSLDDMSKMTYMEATTLELMRLKTVLPLGVPHLTMCDTEVGGFFIPKKTNVCYPIL